MDGVVIGYVAIDHRKFLLYCLMAAVTSAIGSLIPYYVGRAGGELFLLKRINRERYERLRDRFERQEFMAIMIPAMMPPPMPIKLFEFGAGVFEMKPLPFVLAIFAGKFIQFPSLVRADYRLLRTGDRARLAPGSSTSTSAWRWQCWRWLDWPLPSLYCARCSTNAAARGSPSRIRQRAKSNT